VKYFLYIYCDLEKATHDYQSFKRKVYNRKSSVNECLTKFIDEMNSGSIDCTFMVCMVINKHQKWKADNDLSGRDRQK